MWEGIFDCHSNGDGRGVDGEGWWRRSRVGGKPIVSVRNPGCPKSIGLRAVSVELSHRE